MNQINKIIQKFFKQNIKQNPHAYVYEWDINENLDELSRHQLHQFFDQLNIISTSQAIQHLKATSPVREPLMANYLAHKIMERDGDVYYSGHDIDYHQLKPLTYVEMNQLMKGAVAHDHGNISENTR